MKKSHILLICLSAAAVSLTSCSGLADFNQVSNNAIGSVGESIPATVTSAKTLVAEASATEKAIGTGIGAAVGAGAGQLLGGGSGRVASTVGFGALGALAGREIAGGMGQSYVQRLTVKATGTGRSYTVTQPIYKQFGEIPVGTRGTLILSSGNNSHFEPEGY